MLNMYAPVDLTQPLHPSVAPLMDKKLQPSLVKAHKDEFTLGLKHYSQRFHREHIFDRANFGPI
mgnify:CR=1 FL=1